MKTLSKITGDPLSPTDALMKLPPAWHAEAIELLKQNFGAIHQSFLDGTKKAVWLGLFLIFIKERGKEDKSIPHGAFGPWLKANVPDLHWDTCCTYMRLARDVAEKGKFQISEFRNFAGEQRLPPSLLKLVEGKTQQQLFLEFRQLKTDDDGEALSADGTRRGRAIGAGGYAGRKNLAEQKAWVMRRVGRGLKEFDKIGSEILLLDDNALEVLLSDLERRTKLIHAWLRAPL